MADRFFRLEIIEPDGVFYENDVLMVQYNTTEGEVGVYGGHIPMTQILTPGVLTISEKDGDKTAALSQGFVEVTEDSVSMIAEAAEWPEEIDVNRAKEAEIRARRILDSSKDGKDVGRAELALKRSLVRQKVAK